VFRGTKRLEITGVPTKKTKLKLKFFLSTEISMASCFSILQLKPFETLHDHIFKIK
jgi:hypothetical protein